MRRTLLPVLWVCCGAFLHSTALADDWRGWRRDPGRTARATGTSDVHKPAVRWRHYVGGSLSAPQYLVADVTGDSKNEVLYISGGKVVAKRADDTLLWETAPLAIYGLKDLYDLDGDGNTELLCLGRGGKIYILAPKTGKLLWEMADSAHSHLGAVLVADLDGDKRPDVYVAEATCGSSKTTVFQSDAYSFAKGYAATVKPIWVSPYKPHRSYMCGVNDVVADVDNDGKLEIVAQDTAAVHVYNGQDGTHKYATTAVGSIPYGTATTAVLDTDGKAPPEVVFFTNQNYGATINSRRVWVMGFDPKQKKLVTRWQYSVSDVAKDRHRYVNNSAVDLDGDGKAELVSSFYDAAKKSWTTRVFDASANGAAKVLATIPNEYLHGLADADSDGKVEILSWSASGSQQRVRGFSGGKLAGQFTALPGLAPANMLNRGRWSRQSGAYNALAWDADGDGKKELLGVYDTGKVHELRAYGLHLGQTPPKLVASYALDPDVGFKAFQPAADVGATGPQLLVPRSDGYLVVLGSGLLPTNEKKVGEFKKRGMRIGGFKDASPVVADLDGDGKRDVIARDSRGKLLRLDPAGASLVVGPKVVWELSASTVPALVDLTGDKKLEVVVGLGTAVRAHKADATLLWSRAVTGAPRGSLVWGDLDGDKAPDLAYGAFNSSGGTEHFNALSGKTGKKLWSADYSLLTAGCGFGYPTLADLTGDKVPDVLSTPTSAVVALNGKDGALLAKVANSSCSAGYPMVFDIDGDGQQELVATGIAVGMRAFEPSYVGGKLTLGTKWTAAGQWFTRVFSTVVTCKGKGAVVVGASYNTSELQVRAASTGTVTKTVALVEGYSFISEAQAKKANRRPGYLGHASAHQDLAGDGQPRVVIGSTDGYLYCVKPCDGAKLDWALDLRAPVSDAIFADTDGDGKDEVLVASEDGFLYALGREHLPAPKYVYENNGKGIATSAGLDIDELETGDTLWANWAKVSGADAYEYAVLTAGGTFVTNPKFVSAGDKTQVKASGLKLKLGQRYFFAVRAHNKKSGKSSGETISDGVLVVDKAAPVITLSASPNPFAPPKDATCTINASFADGHALASYQLVIEDKNGKTIRDWGSQKISSTSASTTVGWDGKDSAGKAVLPGTYTVKATAADTRSHVSNKTVALVVEEAAQQGDGGGPGGGGITQEGCSCEAGGMAGSGWGLLLVVGLLWRRRGLG